MSETDLSRAMRPGDNTFRYDVPVKTVSEANRASHEHWSKRHARAKSHRIAAHDISAIKFMMYWRATGGFLVREGFKRFEIHMTRHAPGTLDSDNLAGSMKHVRDGIADALGIDDGDARLEWTYAQEKTKRGVYFVRVEIRARKEAAA
jgi:hypothetical protein